MNSINFIFLLTIFGFTFAVKVNYEGYKLYKISPKDDSEVGILAKLQEARIGEFWEDGIRVDRDSKVMVSPHKHEEFLQFLKTENIEASLLLDDVQRTIDKQRNPENINESSSYLSYDWTSYHDLDTLYKWLDELEEHHPDVVQTVVMGQSVEGRDIKGIIIHYPNEMGEKNPNPLIGMLEGTLHSREWISVATVTWIIKEFLTSEDPEIRHLAESFEWHIFPIVNPDGYVYTFTDNRMWRKNRSPESVKTCAEGVDDDMSHGVDLNRNFDVQWMVIGASNDSCTNTYAGPGSFSEPESRAIAGYVQRLDQIGRIIYYLAFHSYTQLILVPYSHVNIEDAWQSRNYADMYEIAIRGMDKLKAKHNTNYQVGTSGDILYYVSGSSFDWVKGAEGIPIVYLFELRDVGEYGFLLPAERIIPNNEEIMAGLLEMERVTRSMGYYNIQNDLLFPPTTQPPTDTTEATEPSTTAAPGSGMKTVFSVFLIALSLFVTL
ncbi:zinc carboxypeptidase-like isoform X1 [Spodoptera frugiperda]|uniref:Zinc carboxypeptidase A 1 n=1 Tax=Spodoptera frugiperda TaxID=7108 RepID=A0A9R0DQ62_SPOFR|nr:zinc carboxypeptidase-like isoform X1 [Spodoptera frugiperda]